VANVSGWKNFEWQVALALGGKRRLRTMESFGKEAPDVFWPKQVRKQNPILKTVVVECKKRKAINVHSMYCEASLKYGKGGRLIVLATRIPATKRGRERFDKLKKQLSKRHGQNPKKMKLKTFITPLVTINLDFFKMLWEAWLAQNKSA
jgi:hypothetical protein